MKWYKRAEVAEPPAYIMERISDLRHACDMASRSPSEARSVIMDVAKQLSAHHDGAYADALVLAAGRMLDSPVTASKGVQEVIMVMLSEREQHDAEMEMKKYVKRL